MPIFLDTRGKSNLGIAICARCSVKYPNSDLSPDPNAPGLMVCPDGCKDDFDPWRLAPRETEDITLQYSRGDVDIDTPGPTNVYANQIDGIAKIQFARTWQADRTYLKGDSVTPQNVNDPDIELPQYQFLALNDGTSGATPPTWPTSAGVPVTDGTIAWLCLGIFVN